MAFYYWIEPVFNEHEGIRTPDPQNRNLMLYPLSYMSLCGMAVALPSQPTLKFYHLLTQMGHRVYGLLPVRARLMHVGKGAEAIMGLCVASRARVI